MVVSRLSFRGRRGPTALGSLEFRLEHLAGEPDVICQLPQYGLWAMTGRGEEPQGEIVDVAQPRRALIKGLADEIGQVFLKRSAVVNAEDNIGVYLVGDAN